MEKMAATLCTKRVVKIKDMIQRTVVRPMMMYGLQSAEKGEHWRCTCEKKEDGKTIQVFGDGEGRHAGGRRDGR